MSGDRGQGDSTTAAPGFNDRRRWGRRLAFPLAALAVAMAVRATSAPPGEGDGYWVAAAICAAAGVLMLRLSRGGPTRRA